MSEGTKTRASQVSAAERRWASLDRTGGVLLASLSSVCLGVVVLRIGSHLAGNLVHPDAVLLPFAAAIVLGLGGALLLLAASAMRRGLPNRWLVQWGALLAPIVFALFVLLSAL